MDTPRQMSLADTQARISHYLSARCRRDELNRVICAQCGGEIRRVRAYMSLHDERFGGACIGPARAWRMEIPYCVCCEAPPSPYGCIHMSEEELGLASVVEASRPFGRERPEYRKQFPPLTLQAGSSPFGIAHGPSNEHAQDGEHDRSPEGRNESIHAKSRDQGGGH